MLSEIADLIRKKKGTSCSVVIVAGGSSVRMGEDKLCMDLKGRPVLARTLEAFENCEAVKEIILVAREDRLEQYADLCARWRISKVRSVVVGGASRTKSALAGLSHIDRKAGIVLIHDGARPLVTGKLICDVIHTTALYKTAVPAIQVTDTVKEVEGGVVKKTLDRSRLVAVQTPQGFVPEIIKAALSKAVEEGREFTDDCAAVEAMGFSVRIVRGSEENIKITCPVDLPIAEGILERRHG